MFLPVTVFCIIFGSYSFQHVSAHIYRERIVGGVPTTIEQHPYQVFILGFAVDRVYTCGGSIISEIWILTAAHCVSEALKITGRIGSTYKRKGGITFKAKSYFTHENYRHLHSDFDIGLIELYNPLTFSSPQMKKIKFAGPLDKELNDLDDGVITGWGTTYENGTESEVLLEVHLPIISTEKCHKIFPHFTINENNICAGLKEGGKDSCQGDSGGPLVVGEVQVGIVSWGVGCAVAGFPGVYTKVASFNEWINSKISVTEPENISNKSI